MSSKNNYVVNLLLRFKNKSNKIEVIKNIIIQFIKKINFLLLCFINIFWVLPFLLLIRTIRPFILVRMGYIRSDRIGHFIPDTAKQIVMNKHNLNITLKNYFQSKKKGHSYFNTADNILLNKNTIDKTFDLYWFGEVVVNKYWATKIKKYISVYWWVKYPYIINRWFPGWEKHYIPQGTARDTEGLFQKYSFINLYEQEETNFAKNWLTKHGWSEGEPFVCLFVRDSEFLNYFNIKKNINFDWSYHNYRDSDIDTYIPSIQWLVEQGVWIIRMGEKMKKPISFKNKRVIDYAFVEDRNAILDFWFFANCTGCISTASGLDILTMIYKKPNLFVNAMPLGSVSSFQECIWVPKNLKWKDTGIFLTLKEYLKHHYASSNQYEQSGILIEDLSAEEILMSVKEFWYRIHGRLEEDIQGKYLHENFLAIFKKWDDFKKYHKWIHPNFRIGSDWLKQRSKNFFQ